METFSALLALCAGNSPVPGEIPAQRPATRSFDVFFDLRPNKRLSKQWWGCWFETHLCSLWRHRNGVRWLLAGIRPTVLQFDKFSASTMQFTLFKDSDVRKHFARTKCTMLWPGNKFCDSWHSSIAHFDDTTPKYGESYHKKSKMICSVAEHVCFCPTRLLFLCKSHMLFREINTVSRICISNLVITDFFNHGDVIKWKHFPRYWPFVRGIHRSPINCAHKGQWRGALMFSLICAWTNGWVKNQDAGD